MRARLKRVWSFLYDLVAAYMDDDGPRMAAALSYYSIFAMPPVIGLLALAAKLFVEPGELRDFMTRQMQTFIGVESASRIVTVVSGAVRPELTGPTAVLGLVALMFGATGAFVQLQGALNTIWGVEADPRRGDIKNFLIKRVVSLVMIGAFGLLLLLSLLASTAVAMFQELVRGTAPAWIQSWGLPAADTAVSFLAVSALFTIILRYVPDVLVPWRYCILGGVVTGALFTVGKLLIGWYVVHRNLSNVYGVAGSLAVALLWVYYSSVILLLGAEFTEMWATRRGQDVVPQEGAVRIEKKVVYDGDGGGEGGFPGRPASDEDPSDPG